MKTKIMLCLACLVGSLSGQQAPKNQTPAMRDPVTHEELERKLHKMNGIDPMKELEAAQGEDPSKSNQPVDLLESSDIISFNGIATLVPKKAILAAPAKFQERLKLSSNDRFVTWLEFLEANRGWITTIEVSRVQAEGNQILDEKTQKNIKESSNLVVATFREGPISVLPLKVPKDDSNATANTSTR